MLTMSGPNFLALYALLAVLAYALVAYSIKRVELDRGGPEPRQLRDPYAIAYLRGGAPELLRVAVLSLTLREKLRLGGKTLLADSASAGPDSMPPLEAAVLSACAQPITTQQLLRAPQVRASIEDYRQELIRAQLLAGAQTFWARLPVCLMLMAGLAVLAVAKIDVALATGHRNIFFLELLATAAVLSLLIPLFRKRTALGRQMLGQLRALFAELRRRSRDTSATASEAALLAAVFGVYALGAYKQAWGLIWGPAASPGNNYIFVDGSSSSSHNSSSCSSSSSSGGSCSSGSGGGGGGCGGCGGGSSS